MLTSTRADTFDNEEGEEYKASNFGGFSDYFRRKKIKLQNLDADLRSHSTDKPPIFREVVAHVNGYTQPSLNDLHKLIVTHGGGFLQYLDGKTAATHIIASNLTPKKAVEFRKYRIVKPAWVVDSVEAGKLLPWDNYRVVDEGAGQKVLGFEQGKVVSQANVKARGYRDQTDGSWYTSQIRERDGTPKSSHRSPFSSQPPQTPEADDIDDLPPSHQPQHAPFQEISVVQDEDEAWPAEQSLATPPKSGPAEPLDHESEPESHKRANSDRVESPSKRRKMTAEEHNAILLADPNVRKSTVVHPGFLEQYYRESRLHHLSTWKADLKTQLQALAAEKSSSQKSKQKRLLSSRRYILHVDFDSFFAAVSLKKHPEYMEKPAVVAHGNGSGSEIASCNYPARKQGIKNGMWMKRAQDLCPELKILPYDFPAYEEASRSFYDVILATGGVVQSVSIDEALIDVSTQCIAVGGTDGKRINEGGIYREQDEADTLAQRLRDEVKKRTGCAVSVGIGPNILCAKVALRKAKPAGQYQIKPDEVLDFIGRLEVQDLPGVAYSIGGKLEEIGIKFVGDIREYSKERLINALGPKTGEKLWEYSRGVDRAEVGDVGIRKSVSAEVNWGVRFTNQAEVDEFIENLCGELQQRLMKEKVKGRQITMKIMRRAADAPLDPPKHLGHGKCDTFNKSLVLGVATYAKDVLAKEALSILKGYGFSPGELRGIGVQMTRLEPLKDHGDGNQGSQRRLQFTAGEPSKVATKGQEDPIQDDIVTPKKQKTQSGQVQFGSAQLNSDSPSRKPLNTLGTQFLMPTQVDPKVLAELPQDIRAKLAKHVKPPPFADIPIESVEARGAGDPFVDKPVAGTLLPNQSQLDPETLAALPPDVRAEVLAFYRQTPAGRQGDQSVLPQSPRKKRTVNINPAKKPASASFTGPRKRGRPSKAASLAAAAVASGSSTLTQSNFISTRLPRPGPSSRDGVDTDTDIDDTNATDGESASPDPDFLAALPEDIRREVLDEHRRARLRKRGGLTLSATAPNALVAAAAAAGGGGTASPTMVPPGQRTLKLPPRSPRPTFTMRKLWQPDQLRDAVREWLHEFREDGPYGEDVDALGAYLRKVVLTERDLDKAVALVKWFSWLVEDEFEDVSEKVRGKGGWEDAVGKVKGVVHEAVAKRGLGRVEF